MRFWHHRLLTFVAIPAVTTAPEVFLSDFHSAANPCTVTGRKLYLHHEWVYGRPYGSRFFPAPFRSAWRDFRFLAVALGGSFAFLVLANTVRLDLQIAALGAVASVILAQLVTSTRHPLTTQKTSNDRARRPAIAADHPHLRVAANKLTRLLAEFANQSDEILQQAAVAKVGGGSGRRSASWHRANWYSPPRKPGGRRTSSSSTARTCGGTSRSPG